MFKKITLLSCLLFLCIAANAGYIPVALTGFNADIVADGIGSASGSTTADVDGAGYAFTAQDFQATATTALPTYYLPSSLSVTSLLSPGLNFQLMPYSGNNSLRLASGGSGTLTVTTPVAGAEICLLGTAGSTGGTTTQSTANITITFTDATTQVFSNVGYYDWYEQDATASVAGVGRVLISTNVLSGSTTDPHLFELKLALNSSNYSKQIASISVVRSSTNGVMHVMAMAVKTLCTAPTAQPSGLNLTASASSINLSYTAASPAPDKYLIVRTSGAPLNTTPVDGTTYAAGNTLGNGTVVYIGSNTSFLNTGLTGSTSYTYTVYSVNDVCGGGPLYLATTPLTGTATTLAPSVYTWNGSVSTDYQVAGNWTPNRVLPDVTDILQFNNGVIDTVKNIPAQTIRGLLFTNNTTAVFQAPAAATLTLASDNDATTNELNIAAGSSLINNSTTAALTIAFSGTGATGKIAGTLEIANTASIGNVMNFTNAIDTVTATGTFAAGGIAAGTITSTTANLIILGTYLHKYSSVAGMIPVATWGVGSTVKIAGLTTATTAPTNTAQTFYNFTYASPLQTNNTVWATVPTAINGTLTVDTTGTAEWQWSSTASPTINNFVQTKGKFSIGTSTVAKTVTILGNVNQTKGILRVSGTGAVTLNFNGTGGTQNASFVDSAINGPVIYQVSNGGGINLTGTGLLTTTPNFKINSSGGVRISNTNANPINTTLALTYAATGTTLTYDTAGSITATAAVWPATNGPFNVVLNLGNNFRKLTIPTAFASRTIGGTLTMTAGDIDLSSNTLTLGTSATAAGALSYAGGTIRITTGSLVRWYGTTGLPTTAVVTGTAAGFYPISYQGVNRFASIYFSASTALSTGGSIAVGHNSLSGLTTITPVLDGTYSIDKRTNAFWTVTTPSVPVATGTISMSLTGTGLFNAITPANLRLMQSSSIAGNYVAGSGMTVVRTGLSVAQLTNSHYIGANAADIEGVYIAVNTGNWSAGTTWDIGIAPTNANIAYINPGVTVTVDAATNAAKSLTILSGGTLQANANTLTIDSAITNSGTLSLGGTGTVNLGPAGGSNKPFTSTGTLNVNGGTLNINGNMVLAAGSVFNQTAGNVNVDGNAGGNPATSVPSGTVIASWQTNQLNLTGGTFTVVDPHVGTAATLTRAFEYNTTLGYTNLAPTHTFAFGNGVSTDTSANVAGFRFNLAQASTTSRLALGNLVINTGSANNRVVSVGNAISMLGNMIITSGEFRSMSTPAITYLNGNLTVAANGIFTCDQPLYFASYQNATISDATGGQTVSGAGTFRNGATSPTAFFSSLTLRNGTGVTFNIGNAITFSGTTTFVAATAINAGPSRIFMPANASLVMISGGVITGYSQANGWVAGRFQRIVPTGTFASLFPIGDSSYYAPVQFNSGTVTTAGDMWASTTKLDHPNINTSGINPTKSVNRYYTVQPINGTTFNATGAAMTLNWNAADVDAIATPANFVAGNYQPSTWTYPTVASPAATSIKVSGLTFATGNDFAVGEQCAPINITTQPLTHTACIGSPDTFRVILTDSSSANYQWKKAGVNIPGATNGTYVIPVVAAGDAGVYSVSVGSNCPTVTGVTSANATLSLNLPATITTQPVSQTLCENSPVTFSVAATGTGPLTYQWQKNGANISGATATSYTMAAISAADAGNYTVIVGGVSPCGTTVSNTATLTVQSLPLNIVATSSTSFCAGGSVLLKASSVPGLTYVWKNNGTAMVPPATDSAYTASTSGSYTVTITNTANGCSGTSNAIVVNASGAPTSTINPAGAVAICSGSGVVLHGLNTAGLTYEWSLGGNVITGATDSVYTATTAGNYTLKISIGAGCSNTSVATTVSMNPLPNATVTPGGATTFCQGGNVSLCVPSTAGYTYQWKLNTNNIAGATNACYTANASGNYTAVVTNTATGCVATSSGTTTTVNPLPVVTIISGSANTFCAGGSVVLKANPASGLSYIWKLNGTAIVPAATDTVYTATASGAYTVTATNSNGCAGTSAATNVTANPLPNVTITPSNSTTICQGQTTNLCVPSGVSQTYVWKQNGTNIAGATTTCYTASAAGIYTVTVTNTATTCTATSAQTTIVVNPLPTATATLLSATAGGCTGDTVWMTGNTDPTIVSRLWSKNGTAINPPATAVALGATSSGLYTVTNTNNLGCSAVSAPINVSINPKPDAMISYTTPVTFCEGGAVVLNAVTATGTSYQWQNNATPVAGATDNYFVADHNGSYSVTVTNSFGCSETSNPPVLVVVNPLPVPVITVSGNTLTTGSYASYQWYLNSTPINGATSQSYTFTQNGGYLVRVTDVLNCTNYSLLSFVNNVGVKNILVHASDISVYPNPAQNVVNIDAPVKVNIVLRDLLGQTLLSQKAVTRIYLSDIPAGLYLMQISDENGIIVKTEKITKQ
ncbi:immunoglobulin domain-containing protein [Taibaiella soli]|nr:immunoglobulin domain-containing protein [Taibaiella soli]